ncbi:hypothetical protein Hanom_Chr05g00434581 [Helianthus anomalus]
MKESCLLSCYHLTEAAPLIYISQSHSGCSRTDHSIRDSAAPDYHPNKRKAGSFQSNHCPKSQRPITDCTGNGAV